MWLINVLSSSCWLCRLQFHVKDYAHEHIISSGLCDSVLNKVSFPLFTFTILIEGLKYLKFIPYYLSGTLCYLSPRVLISVLVAGYCYFYIEQNWGSEKWLFQGHIVSMWQNQDSNPKLLPPNIVLLQSRNAACRIKMSLILRHSRNTVRRNGVLPGTYTCLGNKQQGQLEDDWLGHRDWPGRLSRELSGLVWKERARKKKR